MRQAGTISLVLGLVALSGVAHAEVKVGKRGAGGSGGTSSKVSWLGFRPTEGGRSEVFLLLTQAVTPRESLVGDRLYVMFDGVGVGKHGQQRALDTRFFDTPIAYVKLTTVGRGGCRDCGSLGKHVKHGKHRKGETAATPAPGPNMSGAGVVVTILFKSGAGTTHDIGSEDSTYDPEPPPHRKDGTIVVEPKPLEAVHRTLVRIGFPPYANARSEEVVPVGGSRGRVVSPEPQAPTDGAGRILVTEPAPKKIPIPPAPKKP